MRLKQYLVEAKTEIQKQKDIIKARKRSIKSDKAALKRIPENKRGARTIHKKAIIASEKAIKKAKDKLEKIRSGKLPRKKEPRI
jgi:hypothetical protein